MSERSNSAIYAPAAAIVATIELGELPRREAVLPARFQPADHVTVPVAEHGRERFVLLALRIEERPACVALREHAADEAHRLQGGPHLRLDVALEFGRSFRILALGRDCDPAREVGLERAAVEIGFGAGGGGFSAHAKFLGTARLTKRNRILTPSPRTRGEVKGSHAAWRRRRRRGGRPSSHRRPARCAAARCGSGGLIPNSAGGTHSQAVGRAGSASQARARYRARRALARASARCRAARAYRDGGDRETARRAPTARRCGRDTLRRRESRCVRSPPNCD